MHKSKFTLIILCLLTLAAGGCYISSGQTEKGGAMEKKVSNVDFLDKLGPYSHIVEANGFIFLSGMVPVNLDKNVRITAVSYTHLTLPTILRV